MESPSDWWSPVEESSGQSLEEEREGGSGHLSLASWNGLTECVLIYQITPQDGRDEGRSFKEMVSGDKEGGGWRRRSKKSFMVTWEQRFRCPLGGGGLGGQERASRKCLYLLQVTRCSLVQGKRSP